MKQILEKLHAHQTLNREEAKQILIGISREEYNSHQIAAFVSVYLMRTISVDELSGFQEALLELCVPLNLDARDAIDVCGTGGDGKDTFNISTLSAFVIAGASHRVIKHGNYGVSSVCGSSNVLEHLGHRFSKDSSGLSAELNRAGICIVHAPLFHPALKSVGPIRRDLGIKTFFNMLGPLVNPAQPGYQLVGVFDLKVNRLYLYLFQASAKKYSIVHSLDGYDEVSLTGPVKVIQNGTELLLSPSDFGLARLTPKSIYGGATVKEAAEIFIQVLDNQASPERTSAVLANSALALQLYHPEKSLIDCVAMAREKVWRVEERRSALGA